MNKLKGSVAAIKMKYLLFVFATVMLVALPTRVYQLLAVVDLENGFFKSNDVTIAALYVVVFLFVLLFMGMSFLSKEVPSPKLPVGKNPILGITSVVMAVGLLWDVFAIEKKVVPPAGEEFIMEQFTAILKANIADNGGILLVLQVVFAVLAIFYFVVFAISHLNGKGSYREFKLLALAPLCWSMTSLIDRLMKAISFVSVSELLFEIFMLVFAMLFFLTFARISSGVFTVDSMWGIYGYGLSACLFAGLVTVPRIVAIIAGRDLVPGYEFNFGHIALLGFIFSYIIASLGVGFKDSVATRKTISQVELPDDAAVVIKKDAADIDSVDMWNDNEIPDLDEEVTEAVAFDFEYDEDFTEETVAVEAEIEEEIIEETVAVEAEIEEEIIEETVAAEPEMEEEIIEETVAVEPEIEEEIVEETIAAEPEIEEEAIEETIAVEPENEEEIIEETIAVEPEIEEEIIEETIAVEPEIEEEIIEDTAEVVEDKPASSDIFKKVFNFGKKEEVEPEVIKPVSLADLRKNKE